MLLNNFDVKIVCLDVFDQLDTELFVLELPLLVSLVFEESL